MRLIKIEDGRSEVGNFYLSSDMSNYAGDSNVTRDVIGKTVTLVSNNKIERKFDLQQFVIVVKKEPWGVDNYLAGENAVCYIGTAKANYGIKDDSTDESSYWKLILQDNHLQSYGSKDGQLWTNVGGVQLLDTIISQGFRKNSSTKDLVLQDYAIYKRAYVTLLNFPEKTIAVLQDKNGNEVRSALFDENMEAQIFLDYCMKGKFVFLNADNNVIYTSDLFNLQYGDKFILSPYELEVIYKGTIVEVPTMLDSLYEKVSIKNLSNTDTYYNLKVSIESNTNDLIQLSSDGAAFMDTLTLLMLVPGQQIDLFIRIYRSVDTNDFQVRNFQLNIE